jgi:hypothetical protein
MREASASWDQRGIWDGSEVMVEEGKVGRWESGKVGRDWRFEI